MKASSKKATRSVHFHFLLAFLSLASGVQFGPIPEAALREYVCGQYYTFVVPRFLTNVGANETFAYFMSGQAAGSQLKIDQNTGLISGLLQRTDLLNSVNNLLIRVVPTNTNSETAQGQLPVTVKGIPARAT